tara:strand:+ start:149 stop:808 length:660 start_codon:yes stop_codon:yes gene_type:complete
MNAEILDNKLILENLPNNIKGIEIRYSGNISIVSTLPESWILRANSKKILIFNINGQALPISCELFAFIGQIHIIDILAADSNYNEYHILVSNPKRNWNSNYYINTELSSMTENWGDIKDLNGNQPNLIDKRNKQILNKNSIINIPTINNQYTKGGEYLLDNKDYAGHYHIQTDLGIAMTGGQPYRNSKPLIEIKKATNSLDPANSLDPPKTIKSSGNY